MRLPATVWILSALFQTAGAVSALAGDVVQVKITNLAFAPSEITVHAGDTIEWVNEDFVDHTATATSGEWDVAIAASAAGRLQTSKPGTFGYSCRFHPAMTGTIHVFAE